MKAAQPVRLRKAGLLLKNAARISGPIACFSCGGEMSSIGTLIDPGFGVGPWCRTGKQSWIDRVAGLLEKSPCRDTDPTALSLSARSLRSF